MIDKAHSGEIAIEIFEKIIKGTNICPDILFVDIEMPGINGFDTILEIKKLINEH